MTSGFGPLPRFAEVHLQRALDLIAERGRIGRKDLTEELGVGEGSVRTILDQLKDRGLISSSRAGHSLTASGRRLVGKPGRFFHVDAKGLTVGRVNVATVVSGAAGRVRRGIEQRDEAIKVGADGATVLVFHRGKLKFPDGFAELDANARAPFEKLGLNEGDVVVIGTGNDAAKAEAGARAAALILSRSRKR